jgi:hypothetical protein
MSRGRLTALLVSALLAALVLPAGASADHTRTSSTISAAVTKLRGTDFWEVEIAWTATCHGSPADKAVFLGTIFMVDSETGERIEVSGVADASHQLSISGTRTWYASSRKRPWTLTPELTIGCHEDFPLDGGPASTSEGAPVTIPPSFHGVGGGGGGGGQGGGSGGGGADPTGALGPRGCLIAVLGTNGADKLEGTDAGDVVVAFAAGDRLRGNPGHDCLIGGTGRDELEGGRGDDRLTGGAGRDTLRDEDGVDAFYGGGGGDYVNARDGRRERVRCGPGVDRAVVDAGDRVRGCELLTRG